MRQIYRRRGVKAIIHRKLVLLLSHVSSSPKTYDSPWSQNVPESYHSLGRYGYECNQNNSRLKIRTHATLEVRCVWQHENKCNVKKRWARGQGFLPGSIPSGAVRVQYCVYWGKKRTKNHASYNQSPIRFGLPPCQPWPWPWPWPFCFFFYVQNHKFS